MENPSEIINLLWIVHCHVRLPEGKCSHDHCLRFFDGLRREGLPVRVISGVATLNPKRLISHGDDIQPDGMVQSWPPPTSTGPTGAPLAGPGRAPWQGPWH